MEGGFSRAALLGSRPQQATIDAGAGILLRVAHRLADELAVRDPAGITARQPRAARVVSVAVVALFETKGRRVKIDAQIPAA